MKKLPPPEPLSPDDSDTLLRRFSALALSVSAKKSSESPPGHDLDTLVQNFSALTFSAGANPPPKKSLDYDSESESLIQGIDAHAPSSSAKKPAEKRLPDHDSDIVQRLNKLALLDTPTKPTVTLPSATTPTRPRPSESIVSPNMVKPPQGAVNAVVHPSPNVMTPPRSRVVSVSPSSTTSSPGKNKVQCSATTKIGKQCSRRVALPVTYSHLDPTPALYCYQHKAQRLIPEGGCYVQNPRNIDRYVKFSDYIPTYLQEHTQLALMKEMEKAISNADETGYVYTFEIRDPNRPNVIQLKVGRTGKLIKRLSEWDKQCRSKEKIPRGWWPDEDGKDRSLLKGDTEAGEPGPFCHRVERLAHIELADLSVHAPYLHPGWPDKVPEPSPSARSTGTRKEYTRRLEMCRDCGVVHREIFTFPRVDTGPYKGKEWHSIVKPVIEKWGRFVREYHECVKTIERVPVDCTSCPIHCTL